MSNKHEIPPLSETVNLNIRNDMKDCVSNFDLTWEEGITLVKDAEKIQVHDRCMIVSTVDGTKSFSTKVPEVIFEKLLRYVVSKPELKIKLDNVKSITHKPKTNKTIEVKEVVNNRPCKKCIHHSGGFLHGYEWQDCKKNWSDKPNGLFYGVIKDTCANWHLRKE